MKKPFFFPFVILVSFFLLNNIITFANFNEVEKTKRIVSEYFLGERKSEDVGDNLGRLREYFSYSNPEEGIKFYGELLSNPKVFDVEDKKAQVYGTLAYLYTSLQQFDISAKYFHLAVESAKKAKNNSLLAWIYLDFGNFLFANNLFREAILYYLMAKDIFHNELQEKELNSYQKANYSLGFAISQENIGLCYQNLGILDSAMYFIQQTREVRLNPQIPKVYQQYYYTILSGIFVEIGQPDSALYYARLSYDFDTNKEISRVDFPEYLQFRSQAEMIIGFAHLLKKQTDLGFDYLDRSIQTVSSLNNTNLILNLYLTIGKFLLKNGFLTEVKKYLDNGLKISESTEGYKALKTDFLKLNLYYFSHTNQLAKLKQYQEKLVQHIDTISLLAKLQGIKYSEMDLQLQNRIQELAALNLEKRQQKVILYLMIALAIILIFLVVFVYFHYKKKKQLANELQEKNIQLNELNQKLKNAFILTEKLNFDLEKSQKELIKINTELANSNRTKDTLFSIIAHDLKNSIGGLKNSLIFLAREEDKIPSSDRTEILQISKNSIENLYIMLENLLLWASSQSKRIVPNKIDSSPYEIAKIVLFNLNEQIQRKKIFVENNIPKDLIFKFDPSLFQIIIQNLLGNSVKFTNPGGEIIIDAFTKGKEVVFYVADNGIGIPREKIEKLFQDIRVESSYGVDGEKGTGLGLSIVKQFVELHNGSIWVESEEGFGTKVYFTFEYLN